jgi:hypothetical protein
MLRYGFYRSATLHPNLRRTSAQRILRGFLTYLRQFMDIVVDALHAQARLISEGPVEVAVLSRRVAIHLRQSENVVVGTEFRIPRT